MPTKNLNTNKMQRKGQNDLIACIPMSMVYIDVSALSRVMHLLLWRFGDTCRPIPDNDWF